jgi:hypothetical protein
MPRQLRIGDRCKVIGNSSELWHYFANWQTGEAIVEIVRIYSHGSEADVKPIENTGMVNGCLPRNQVMSIADLEYSPLHTYNIGDKVIITTDRHDSRYSHSFNKDQIGIIESFGNELTSYHVYIENKPSLTQILDITDFKPILSTVKTKREKPFKINDTQGRLTTMKNEADEIETVPCENCSKDLEEDSDEIFNGSDDLQYCEACYHELFFHCEECDEVTSCDELYTAYNRRSHEISICQDCYEDHYFTCTSCDSSYHTNNAYRYSGDYFCQDCFNDNYFTCESCNETYHNDDYGSDDRCINCESENRVRSCGLINDYGYKPDPTFYETPSSKKDKLYMGIELEVESCGEGIDDMATEITEISPEIYLKSDGSLNDGFEIVTHPCTLDYHRMNLKWEKILDSLKNGGFKSHNTKTCGLHIHVSKSALSEIEAIRLGIFVNLNSENFEKLARRSESSYSKFKHLKKGKISKIRATYTDDQIETPYLSVNKNSDRYEALNYQNRKTIEFRLYKGTLKYHSFISTVELTHAVCYFVKQVNNTMTVIDREKGWNEFINFVKNNKSKYHNLIEYLTFKGFIEAEKQVLTGIETD